MKTEKIMVTIQNGKGMEVFEGDLVDVRVFTYEEDAVRVNGLTLGAIKEIHSVLNGMMRSIFKTIRDVSLKKKMERSLLAFLRDRVLAQMDELERQEAEERPLTTEDIEDLLNSILED